MMYVRGELLSKSLGHPRFDELTQLTLLLNVSTELMDVAEVGVSTKAWNSLFTHIRCKPHEPPNVSDTVGRK